jgi:Tfp pilus assembly protein PilO
MMSSSGTSTKTVAGIVIVALLAAAFWILLLGPKRDKAGELGSELEAQQTALSTAQASVSTALAAKAQFAPDYRTLVSLGKAVPANEETSSLLVELSEIAEESKVKFDTFQLSGEGSTEGGSATSLTQEVGPTSAVSAAETLPPTEAEAALLPLGATIGSAGLGVMPYTLTFRGGFFQIADFIHGIDGLVRTDESGVRPKGRLVTLDGFSLVNGEGGLEATFAVTTYLVPPNQGVTAGATPESPESVPAETESTTTATPSAFQTGSETSAR